MYLNHLYVAMMEGKNCISLHPSDHAAFKAWSSHLNEAMRLRIPHNEFLLTYSLPSGHTLRFSQLGHVDDVHMYRGLPPTTFITDHLPAWAQNLVSEVLVGR